MNHSFCLMAALISAAVVPAFSAKPPVVRITADDTKITQSCIVEIAPGTILADANGNGVIHIEADNVVLRFAEGSELRGAPATQPWDQLTGIGISVNKHTNVTIETAHVHGFKNGLLAVHADGLRIRGGDFSDNFRQRLRSTSAGEDGSDWMFPHNNNLVKWHEQYGGAVCIENSARVTVTDVLVRRGQNGIVIDHVNDSAFFDNDCSFLSGWGFAMWKSSRNMISRNAFDFCVRGHVEGVYNRGQDSAGILCFEQCNDNVFAENSATHGGDGFFGFGGKEALGERWLERERARLRKKTGKQDVDDLIVVTPERARRFSALGANRNLLVDNDFSYASAHGIEMTFSEDNQFVRNRIVENAICGVWGGYSSGTLIAENDFTGNGGMAYGLERGAVNMEHAARNLIIANRFVNNKCGVHLWWDNDAGLLDLPGVTGGEQRVTGNVVAGNEFEINEEAPFSRLRENEKLIALQLRDTSGGGNVFDNSWFGNRVDLSHPQAVEFALEPGCDPDKTGTKPTYEIPKFKALGKKRPVGARVALRGRDQIIMDEWGPWDHRSPLVRLARGDSSQHVYEIFGTAALKPPVVTEGNVHVEIESSNATGPKRLIVSSPTGVSSYRITLAGDGFSKELTGTIIAAEWRLKLFPWKIDPREDLAGWRKLADGPDAVTANTSVLDLPYGMGGPRDQPLGDAVSKSTLSQNHFGMIAKATLNLPKGSWRFATLSDDGIRVSVNGKPIIENWTWHAPTPNEGVFKQTADGEVEIVVEHFEIDGFSTLKLDIEAADD